MKLNYKTLENRYTKVLNDKRKLKKEVEKQQEEITSLKIEMKKKNKKIEEKDIIIDMLYREYYK